MLRRNNTNAKTSRLYSADDHKRFSISAIVAAVQIHRNHCQLPRETLLADDKVILARFSHGNKLTRWFYRLNIISLNNPITEKYFRSEIAAYEEKVRHIELRYWYIVHPLSSMRIYFEIWQLFLYLTMVIVKPMNAAIPTSIMRQMKFFPELSTILDLLSWLTIIFTFFNGYIIEHTRTMVLEPKRIAWHYISSVYFVCDVLSSIPVFPVVHLIEVLFKTRHVMVVGILYMLCELKLIRIVSVIQCISKLAAYWEIKARARVFLCMCIIVTLFSVHNFALLQLLVPKLIRGFFATSGRMDQYLWFVKHQLLGKPFLTLYLHCVFRSSAYILAIDVDILYKDDEETEDYILAMVAYVVGKLLISTIYVILAVTILSSRSMEIKFVMILDQLEEYMRQKQLPLDLQARIKKYYNFKYQKRYFKETMVHDMLSAKLKTDINLHVCRSLIMNVSLFADLTAEQISNVVDLLTAEIFMIKDTICQSGSDANCMYFISSGTVAVYTHSGREVCHLEDGAYFGEIGMVLRIPKRCATIIAIETTHVYVLKKADFNMCLLENRKVMRKVRKIAQIRYSEIQEYEDRYKKMLFEQEHRGQYDHSNNAVGR